MYNSKGEKTWEVEYDIYGKVRKLATGALEDCPFRYQGMYFDEETELCYNRYRYYSPDTGTYLSQDPIGLAGGMPNMYAYVEDSNSLADPLGLSRDTPAWKARGWQGSGDYPGVDTWRTTTLKKGTIVYGGVPGQSEFYLSKSSLDAASSKEALWESAQVKPHDKFGYRSQVQAYVLTEDVKVGKSTVSANPQFGKGGATQYFIEDFESKLKPVGDPIDLKPRGCK